MKNLIFFTISVTILILVGGTFLNAEAAIPATERAALIDFYNSTNGDNWDWNGGWKTPPLDADGFAMPGTEASWFGVTVVNDHVTRIDMWYFADDADSGNDLYGKIPSSISNFQKLERLDLRRNRITSIPTEIGSLINLKHLNLYANDLTSIPPEIGSLNNLEYLWLNGNCLISIPSEIGNLTRLGFLSLRANCLTSVPPEIGNLTNLTYFNLSYNELSIIPPEIGHLTSLTVLELSGNYLTSIPSEIGNLANLENLTLWGNKLTSIPSEIVNLANLEGLSLEFNALNSDNNLLINFLQKVSGYWQSTQTIFPNNLSPGLRTENSIDLSWSAISYSSDTGGYQVYYSTTYSGPYTLYETTSDKTVESATVTGLTPCTDYYFILRTVTYPHKSNKNTVYSEYTDEVSASTVYYTDSDGDGLNDCIDVDDDNDGISDDDDEFPLDDTESLDTDGDGTGNNADTDDDNDGISDQEEDSGLNNGDSNDDGILDSLQSNVTTFQSNNGDDYIILVSSDGTVLTDCGCSEPAPDAPDDMVFDYSLFKFTVTGIPAGGSTTVTLILPDDHPDFDSYYRYGPTPDNTTPHWYKFLHDGQTGAEIDNQNGLITLHFVDGERGDDDLTINGTVVDMGGPARTVTSDDGNGASGDSGGGGGCFISTINE